MPTQDLIALSCSTNNSFKLIIILVKTCIDNTLVPTLMIEQTNTDWDWRTGNWNCPTIRLTSEQYFYRQLFLVSGFHKSMFHFLWWLVWTWTVRFTSRANWWSFPFCCEFLGYCSHKVFISVKKNSNNNKDRWLIQVASHLGVSDCHLWCWR